MKIENSLDYFKSRKEMHLSDICQRHEDNAIAALEKQIPKEATTQGISNDGYWVIKCPECDTVMEGMRYVANFCCACGQAITWSD